MNNMVPGIAGNGGTDGAPVVEYNKRNQYNGDPSETARRPEFEPLRDALLRQGLLDDPVMIQLCMGIAYGAPDDPTTFMALVHQLPPGAIFSAFSISRMQLPFVAMAALAGGNVRVGLEDNIYLSRGEMASNADLVGRAVKILENMNVNVIGPDAVRKKLQLTKHS